jgi:membrane dipeptidase
MYKYLRYSATCTFGKDTAFKFANIELDSLYAIAARNPDKMMIVQSPKELLIAVKQKKLAAMIGVEGGHMIEENIAYRTALQTGCKVPDADLVASTSWATSSLMSQINYIKNTKRGLNDLAEAS